MFRTSVRDGICASIAPMNQPFAFMDDATLNNCVTISAEGLSASLPELSSQDGCLVRGSVPWVPGSASLAWTVAVAGKREGACIGVRRVDVKNGDLQSNVVSVPNSDEVESSSWHAPPTVLHLELASAGGCTESRSELRWRLLNGPADKSAGTLRLPGDAAAWEPVVELSRGVVVQLLPSTTLPPLIYRLVRGVVPLGGIRVRLAASIQAPQIGSIHVGAFPGDLLPVSRVDHGWLKLHPAAYSILQSSRSFSAHDPFEDGWCLLQSGAAAAGERSYFEMASLQVEKCWPGSTIQKLESQITAVILNYNPGRVTILQTAFDEVKASNVANPVGALTELYLKTCELFASASNKRPFDLFMDELSIEDDPYSELNSVASTLSPDTIASPTFEPIAAFGAPGPAQSTAPPLTAAQSLLGIGTIDKWVGIFKETQTTIDVEQVRLSPLSQKWRDVAAATKEIFIAAYNGEEGIVRRCIYDGARTDDYRDNDGKTALIVASARRHAAIVEILLEAGSEMDEKDDLGYTALMWAAYNGHTTVVKLLLKAGAETENRIWGQSALINASQCGRVAIVELLLQAGANIEAKNQNGSTALIWASSKNQATTVELLLRAGADKDAKDEEGTSALMHVSRKDYTCIMKLLLEAGASVEAMDKNGDTALICATIYGRTAAIKLLLEAGADKDCKNADGNTGLMLAAANGEKSAVKLFLEAGADTEAKNASGDTALMCASRKGSVTVVKLLLEASADKEAKDAEGFTPLVNAAFCGRESNVKLLLQAGSDAEGWCELPAAALSQRAYKLNPSFSWAPVAAQTSIVTWARDAATVQLSYYPQALADLSDDCVGDVLEYLMMTMARKEMILVATQYSSPEACAWVQEVLAAAVEMEEEKKKAEIKAKKAAARAQLRPAAQSVTTGTMREAQTGPAAERDYFDTLREEEIRHAAGRDNFGATRETQTGRAAQGINLGTTRESRLRPAARSGDLATVQDCIANGVNVDAQSANGATALIRASQAGHTAIVRVLIQAGANINATDRSHRTALTNASLKGHTAIVELLRAAGAH